MLRTEESGTGSMKCVDSVVTKINHSIRIATELIFFECHIADCCYFYPYIGAREQLMDKESVTRVRAIQLLWKKRMACGQANELPDFFCDMAPQNIIARFESKMDAQTAEIAASAKRQNTNYS